MERSERLEELWTLVRQIPKGRCAAYSVLGRSLSRPVSGFLVGKWMNQAPPDVPWWRVVLKDGGIALDKSNPEAGLEQRKRLAQEGVPFEDDRAVMSVVAWEP